MSTPVTYTTTHFAGVVGYQSGTVVWSLAWAQTSPGTPPFIDASWTGSIAPGNVAVAFPDPMGSGARGTATLTATVDGVPANAPITATVPELQIVALWCDPPDTMAAVTSERGYSFAARSNPDPDAHYFGGVLNLPVGSTVSWEVTSITPEWAAFPTLYSMLDLGNNFFNATVVTGEWYDVGEMRIAARVDGVLLVNRLVFGISMEPVGVPDWTGTQSYRFNIYLSIDYP